jgi:HTH-type transcriptional regulator, competence development regulator
MKKQPTEALGKTLGEGLRTARGLRKLSLRQVEEATGISNAYLSQLENDKIKKPSPHFLHKLAALYDIGYDLLMETAGYIRRKDTSAGDTVAGAAFRSLGELSPEEEEQLADYLAYLRSKQR